MIKCKTNSGCKMIQRPNHCCPDYTCDCEHKGRIYNNGERLELEDAPCQVCYCKGGEVMCTSITCYERTDCQPRYVPGQCCPKYDHCPLETKGNSSSNSTILGSKREIQTWPLSKHITVKPIEVLKPITPKVPEEPPVYPQTLRIHEIIPTTPKYERPNGKRPALSTVPKVPYEIHIEEIGLPAAESDDFSGSDDESKDLLTLQFDEGKGKVNNFSITTSPTTDEALIDSTTVSATVADTSGTTGLPVVNTSNAPLELSRVDIEQDSSTDVTLPDLGYEVIIKDIGSSESSANLIDKGNSNDNGATFDPRFSEIDVTPLMGQEPTAESVKPSTENLLLKSDSVSSENSEALIINDDPTTTLRDSFSNFEQQFTSPETEISLDSETIDPTADSFTLKMEPLMLSGGIYDEINDTMLYNDDNDVKQEDTTPHTNNMDYTSTTEKSDELQSFKSVEAQSALSQVFEKFVEIPQSSVSSIRRSDDWFSENYQLIPGDGTGEDADESSLDLNIGATSHSDTRVSPTYYLGDQNESFLMTGRSLAPYSSNSKDTYSSKGFSDGKFQTNINRIAKVNSNEDTSLESGSSEEFRSNFNPYEQSDLYLSITGKNSSSNETILHMILSPKDLKQLAEKIIKENSNRTESNLKETEVRIEWLTQEQLSKLKPEAPKVNINLTKCNFTGFTDMDLRSEKLKEANDEGEDLSNNAERDQVRQKFEGTSEDGIEISTILLSTISELLESTTIPYVSSTESSVDQNFTVITETSITEEPSTKKTEKQGPDTSTIRVYEIRKSGSINDKLIDLFITTEGPYGSDKGSSPSFDTSKSISPKSEVTKRSDSMEESVTLNDFETTTTSSLSSSDRPRKKNLPDVEPFLRQLPSTLDEKDVSILRDFLERHLSEPPSR